MSYNQFGQIRTPRQKFEENTIIQEEYSIIEEETFCLQDDSSVQIKVQAQSSIIYQPFANLGQCSIKDYKEQPPFDKEKVLKKLKKTLEEQEESYYYYKKLNRNHLQPQFHFQCKVQGCGKAFLSIEAYYSHLQIKHNSNNFFKSNYNEKPQKLQQQYQLKINKEPIHQFSTSRKTFSSSCQSFV